MYDQNFDVKFTKLYEIESYMSPACLIQIEDGSFMIAGFEGATSEYTIWLIRTDSNGDLLSVTGPEINTSLLSVFPNPTSEYISIKSEIPDEAKLVIISEEGKLIRTCNGKGQIDVKQLPAGTYYLNLIKDHILLANKRFVKI